MSLPVVSTSGKMPLFTIEQIELIRRLRNSGITKEQVIQAFDSLNRIDSELGNLYTIPQSLAPMVVKTTQPPQINPRPMHIQTQIPVQPQVICKQIKKTVLNVCQSAKASSTTEVPGAKRRRRSSLDDEDRTDETNETGYGDESEAPHKQNAPSHGVGEELKGRLEEFMRLPAPRRLEEILTMVSVAGVRVPDIAASTGLSNITIGRFLQGETVDISTNQKRSIYLWYLRQVQKTEGGNLTSTSPVPLVHSPTSLGTTRNKVMQVMPHSDPTKQVLPDLKQEFSGGHEKVFEYPGRRERFIFREKHLEILDEAFRSNQYPSSEEREEIAQRCNKAMEAIVGKELSERQTVTCYVVSNWFNNRRKEIKRIAREEGIACSQVILPCRQRQRLPADLGFHPLDETTSSSMGNDSESNQLDPATINKLLYEVTENNLPVKLEPPDENSPE